MPCSVATGRNLQVVPLQSPEQAFLVPATLGVLVNLDDPQSVELGKIYAEKRGIPAANIFGLRLPQARQVLPNLMQAELDKLKNWSNYAKMAGFALAFSKPYRVGRHQSITSAVTQGLSSQEWRGNCNLTSLNPDRNTPAGGALQTKPAMLLTAGPELSDAVALVDRGIAADATNPDGGIYLVVTRDRARAGPRTASMQRSFEIFEKWAQIENPFSGELKNTSDILGYEIGIARFSGLASNRFLPGAFADHLTSFGGALEDKHGQSTILELIRAGATASYGTVREPCNFADKFPEPSRMIANYLGGDSMIEAYWKSVSMTTEGLFVGEPLSRPFRILDAELVGDQIHFRANKYSRPFLASREGVCARFGSRARAQVYALQSGESKRIGEFEVDCDFIDGAEIGTMDAAPSERDDLILGIVFQPEGL